MRDCGSQIYGGSAFDPRCVHSLPLAGPKFPNIWTLCLVRRPAYCFFTSHLRFCAIAPRISGKHPVLLHKSRPKYDYLGFLPVFYPKSYAIPPRNRTLGAICAKNRPSFSKSSPQNPQSPEPPVPRTPEPPVPKTPSLPNPVPRTQKTSEIPNLYPTLHRIRSEQLKRR